MPPWFLVPLTIELGDGWRGIRDDVGLQVNLVRGENEVEHATQWLGVYAIRTEEVPAFIEELKATPLLEFGETKPVEVAGLMADRFDGHAEPNPNQAASTNRVAGSVDIPAMRLLHNPRLTDFAWYTESAEARLGIVLSEQGENTLVFYLEAPPDQVDEFMEIVDPVLASVVLEG